MDRMERRIVCCIVFNEGGVDIKSFNFEDGDV